MMRLIATATLYATLLLLTSCSFSSHPKKSKVGAPKSDSVSRKVDRSEALPVTATAYTMSATETDDTPGVTACGMKLFEGASVIAVSRDLESLGYTCGTKVTVAAFPDRVFEVQDRMAARWERKIDIFFGTDRDAAIRWGKRSTSITKISP